MIKGASNPANILKSAALFAVLALFVLSPMFFSELGVKNMFGKPYLYEAQDTRLDDGRNASVSVWDKLRLTKGAVMAVGSVVKNPGDEEERFMEQFFLLAEYGALPTRDFTEALNDRFYTKIYVDRESGATLEGLIGIFYYEYFEIEAFMDSENGALYDVEMTIYDDADIRVSAAGFRKYLENFSKKSEDGTFRVYSDFRENSVRYYMYSANDKGYVYEYPFLDDAAPRASNASSTRLSEYRVQKSQNN